MLGAGQVTGVSVRPLGSSDGFTGQVVRLALTGSTGVPATLIAKFPNADEDRKALFHRLAFAQREVAFYRNIGPIDGIRLARLYFGAVDADTADSILLLEDLGADGCLGSLASDCSAEDAIAAVGALARLQARYWGGTDDFAWLPDIRRGVEKAQQELAGPWRTSFDTRIGASAPELVAAGSPVADLLDLLANRFTGLRAAMAAPPTTILHSDFRADNIFRMADGDIAVIDWENAVRARGAVDLGLFAAASLSVESRRTVEAAMLAAYVDAVTSAGADGCSLAQCVRDYRLGIAQAMVVTVIGVVVLDSLTLRDPAWSVELVRRLTAMIDDHGLVTSVRNREFDG